MAESQQASAIQAALQPLLDALVPVHGDRLRAVIAYGPWLEADQRELARTALVVIDGLTAADLRATAPAVGQLRRTRLEPLFLAAGELALSLDVFPLEFLEMQAGYLVVHGEDLLAGLEFPPTALRLQLEEELRGSAHCLRQEVARHGHRPKAMRLVVARTFAGLARAWRGLLNLAGQDIPTRPEALVEAVALAYRLDPLLLAKLHRIETGALVPPPEALDQVVDELDGLLDQLVHLVDGLSAG